MRQSPAVRRSIVAAAAALSLALAVSGRAGDASTASSVAAPPDLLTRIRILEHDGDSHPRLAAEALDALTSQTAPFSAERLELLTVRGLLLAQASEPETADRVAQALDDWARSRRASDAAAAALLVRARTL